MNAPVGFRPPVRWAPLSLPGRFWGAAAALAFFASLGPAAGAAEFRIVGSDLLGPAFTLELGEFARRNNVDFSLDLTGTRPALAALARGEAELGLLVLPAGETPPRGPFVSLEIAYQPVAVIVPADSAWREITVAQLAAAFGADDPGSAEPAPAGRIAPVLLEAPDGLTAPLFQQRALGGAAFRANLTRVADRVALLDRLRTLERGLALVPFVPSEGEPWRALPVVPHAGAAAVAPVAEELARGAYPWSLVLRLMVRRADAPRLRALLRFLLTEEGAAALRAVDFLPPPAAARQRLLAEWEQLR